MGRTSDLKIRIRLQEDYEFLSNLGYNVLGVFLYSSQNYEMDTENSDIDTKAIIIPNFEDLISRKVCLSVKHELETTKTLVDRASNWEKEFEYIIKSNQLKVDMYIGSFMKIIIGRCLLEEFDRKGFGAKQ